MKTVEKQEYKTFAKPALNCLTLYQIRATWLHIQLPSATSIFHSICFLVFPLFPLNVNIKHASCCNPQLSWKFYYIFIWILFISIYLD